MHACVLAAQLETPAASACSVCRLPLFDAESTVTSKLAEMPRTCGACGAQMTNSRLGVLSKTYAKSSRRFSTFPDMHIWLIRHHGMCFMTANLSPRLCRIDMGAAKRMNRSSAGLCQESVGIISLAQHSEHLYHDLDIHVSEITEIQTRPLLYLQSCTRICQLNCQANMTFSPEAIPLQRKLG